MRKCETCPEDISQRHINARFCDSCAEGRELVREKNRVRSRAKVVPSARLCKSCSKDISHRASRAIYCEACVKRRRNKSSNEFSKAKTRERRVGYLGRMCADCGKENMAGYSVFRKFCDSCRHPERVLKRNKDQKSETDARWQEDMEKKVAHLRDKFDFPIFPLDDYKYKKNPEDIPKDRQCLKCNRTFKSIGFSNRLCLSCRHLTTVSREEKEISVPTKNRFSGF